MGVERLVRVVTFCMVVFEALLLKLGPFERLRSCVGRCKVAGREMALGNP